MSSDCTHECSACSENCSERTAESFLKSPREGAHIGKVIAVISGKGGVGKSLVTGLMAAELQRKGHRAAVMDADVTGPSIPQMFGVHEKAEGGEGYILPVRSKSGVQLMSMNSLLPNETDPVIWRGPIIANIVEQFWTTVAWQDVDYMFVDMPPGTGDVPLTVFQSLPISGVLVVTSPQELVGIIVEKAVHMAAMMNKKVLGIVENMAYFTCPDCGAQHSVFGESRVAEAAEKFGIPNVARLPLDPALAKACDEGRIEEVRAEGITALADYIERGAY
ncbi:MAG TPA: ATP-binding protein [Clostridiales bacterium]|nr:ATP-binding protein [Clostridiales bacterium]